MMFIAIREDVFMNLLMSEFQQIQSCFTLALVGPVRYVDGQDRFWSAWISSGFAAEQCEAMDVVMTSLNLGVEVDYVWGEAAPEWISEWNDPGELPPVED